MTPAEAMLIIKALDNDACLRFSDLTYQWYVDASIEIGNGVTLSTASEHCADADAAVLAFFARITSLAIDEYLVSRHFGQRRQWRWNGGAFVECTQSRAEATT